MLAASNHEPARPGMGLRPRAGRHSGSAHGETSAAHCSQLIPFRSTDVAKDALLFSRRTSRDAAGRGGFCVRRTAERTTSLEK